MNHLGFLLLASITLGVTLPTAQATPQQIEYLGVEPGDDAKNVAIAVIGTPSDAKTYHRCNINFFSDPTLRKKKRIPNGRVTLALAPGKHHISALFRDIDREAFITKEFVFETGQRYRIDCHGENLRDAEIVIRAIDP